MALTNEQYIAEIKDWLASLVAGAMSQEEIDQELTQFVEVALSPEAKAMLEQRKAGREAQQRADDEAALQALKAKLGEE